MLSVIRQRKCLESHCHARVALCTCTLILSRFVVVISDTLNSTRSVVCNQLQYIGSKEILNT